MNARVLELIKNPEIISFDDLAILESESKRMPYAQSIRAIYLYGIHLFQPELYKENLSKTAAYTTDKKILYQFVNAKKSTSVDKEISAEVKPIVEEEIAVVNEVVVEDVDELTIEDNIDVQELIEEIVELDLTEESVELENPILDETIEELIIEEPAIVEVVEKETNLVVEPEESNNDLSFSGAEDFLPTIKFEVPKNHLDYLNPKPKKEFVKKETPFPLPKTPFVEKVEPKELEISELENSDAISFENIQSFDILPNVVVDEIKTDVVEEIIIESIVEESVVEEWKPMNFSSNIPDALIGKASSEPIVNTKPEVAVEEKVEPIVIEEIIDSPIGEVEETQTDSSIQTNDELPVINVSFFGSEVQKIEDRKEEPKLEKVEVKPLEKVVENSNVGDFINTWQSWLKIDRSLDSEIETTKVKEKIIDNFIENNPKISQLKEESNYVVKEKKEDISHLMTETLANLYVEQKLYSKAIKAFEVLIEKHPNKTDYFGLKIEEIKELRKPF